MGRPGQITSAVFILAIQLCTFSAWAGEPAPGNTPETPAAPETLPPAREMPAVPDQSALPLLKGEEPVEPPCKKWAGVYPTVLTPFCSHGVDVASLEKQIRRELAGGCKGLVLLGTLGEGEYVNTEERADVIRTAVRVAGPCHPVIVGIHTCNIDEATAQLLAAKELGAAAVLVKYLGNPHAHAKDVLGFYAALSDLQALPILYYHLPSETHLMLLPRAIADIIMLPGVIGIKEAILDLREVQLHLHWVNDKSKVFFTATCLDLTQFLDTGGHGAMCPQAVLMPDAVVQCYSAWMAGHRNEARAIQKELFVVLPIERTNPTPPCIAGPMEMSAQDHKIRLPMGHEHPQARLKVALDCLGVRTSPAVKQPLPEITGHQERRVLSACCKIKQIDWAEVASAAAPLPNQAGDPGWPGLLKTGPFQLGPGVSRDLLRSSGDGQWGY